MLNIKFFYLFSFLFFIILDYLIKNNYLGGFIKTKYLNFIELSYLEIVIIIATIALSIVMLFSSFFAIICFDCYLLEFELFNSMSDVSDVNSNTRVNSESDNNSHTGGTNRSYSNEATINIKNPDVSVSLPLTGINNIAAVSSVVGGGVLAIKVMQQIPGGPGVKAAAGAATMLGSQALTLGMSKILNNSNPSTGSNSPNYISFFDSYGWSSGFGLENNNLNFISSITSLGDKYTDFPLNLLPEINQLVTAELMFLFVILNILFVKYLISLDLDLNKYTPKNKLGELLKWLISRYIQMYSKSAKILLIFCFIGLFICVIGSKIFLYYVLN